MLIWSEKYIEDEFIDEFSDESNAKIFENQVKSSEKFEEAIVEEGQAV